MVLLAAAAYASSALAAARAPDVSRAQPQRADSLAVVAIVSNLHAALVRGDSTLVISMLQPDAYIIRGGIIRSVREYRSGGLRADIERARRRPETTSLTQVTVRGAFAWAVTPSRVDGSVDLKGAKEVSAELIVLSKTARGWRINAIQWSSTVLPPS